MVQKEMYIKTAQLQVEDIITTLENMYSTAKRMQAEAQQAYLDLL